MSHYLKTKSKFVTLYGNMKKVLFFLFIYFSVVSVAFGATFSPISVQSENQAMTVLTSGSEAWSIFSPDGIQLNGVDGADDGRSWIDITGISFTNGLYHILLADSNDVSNTCFSGGFSYEACKNSVDYLGTDIALIVSGSFNPSFVIASIGATSFNVVEPLVDLIPLILVIFAALVGLGISLFFVLRWLNSPNSMFYDSSRGSYRFGKGRRVKTHSGNMLE